MLVSAHTRPPNIASVGGPCFVSLGAHVTMSCTMSKLTLAPDICKSILVSAQTSPSNIASVGKASLGAHGEQKLSSPTKCTSMLESPQTKPRYISAVLFSNSVPVFTLAPSLVKCRSMLVSAQTSPSTITLVGTSCFVHDTLAV